MHRLRRLAVLAAIFALAATACGGGGDDDETTDVLTDFVVQGDDAVDLSDSTTTTEAAPDAGASGAGESNAGESNAGDDDQGFDVTEDTIPDGEEETPEGEFFDAVGVFMSCLDSEGYTFIGIPNGGDESEPVNDPGYGSALGDCAARSEIVSKMEAAEDSSRFSAEEIEERNRGFTVFVDCLIGRGWTIPPLTPDANGSLQPPYVELASSWIPPDGGSLLDGELNDDFGDCGISQAVIEGQTGDES